VRSAKRRIAGLVATAALVASGLGLAADTAQAEVTAQPALSHFYPLDPPPGPTPSDPRSEVQELLRQTTELHDNWDSLSPDQRNQQLNQLQHQATTVQRDIQNLPPDQQPEVEGMLWQAVTELAGLLGKAQSPNQPCFFPLCLPGL
jgi:hypothetical protein